MVHLGMANSRMKDFYDIWMLSRLFEFDGVTLARAVERTFERRRTAIPSAPPLSLTAEFYGDAAKAAQWQAFLRRNSLGGEGTTFKAVADVIEGFLMPLCNSINAENRFAGVWPMGGPWRP